MALQEIDVQWTMEDEWDSDWQTLYSGVAYLLDDQTNAIVQENREKHSNARSNSTSERVISSSIVNPSEVPPHVLEKLVKRGFVHRQK